MENVREEFLKKHKQLLEHSRKALTEDRARKDALEGLIRHPGWKVYVELLNSMVTDRGSQVLAPAAGEAGMILLEFVKGSMNGLILARDLPQLIIDNIPAAKVEDDDDE